MKRALLCGINYKGTDAELAGCVNDITEFKRILIDTFKWKEQDITFLKEAECTKAKLESELKKLSESDANTLIFYYSGHGSNLKDKNSDEKDGKDEVLVPVDYNTKGVITDDWIAENLVSKLKQGCKLYSFVDACHSGSMLDLKYNYTYTGKDVKEDKFTLLLEGCRTTNGAKGTVCSFSGCMDIQTSADAKIAGKNTGAFSNCLQSCLTKPGLKVYELAKLINLKLKEFHFDQVSILSCNDPKAIEKEIEF